MILTLPPASTICVVGGADADLLDRPAEAVDDDDVPDVEDLFKNDEQPRDNVRDQGLRAETDDQPEDPDTGEDRRGIKSRGLQNEEEQNDHRRVFDQAAEDLDDRLPAVKQPRELHQNEPDDETHAEQKDPVTDHADRDIVLPGFAKDVEAAPEFVHRVEHLVAEDPKDGVSAVTLILNLDFFFSFSIFQTPCRRFQEVRINTEFIIS